EPEPKRPSANRRTSSIGRLEESWDQTNSTPKIRPRKKVWVSGSVQPRLGASVRPKTKNPTARTENTVPRGSKTTLPGPRDSGTWRSTGATSTRPRMPVPSSNHLQAANSDTTPPSVDPAVPPRNRLADHRPTAGPRRSAGTTAVIVARVAG